MVLVISVLFELLVSRISLECLHFSHEYSLAWFFLYFVSQLIIEVCSFHFGVELGPSDLRHVCEEMYGAEISIIVCLTLRIILDCVLVPRPGCHRIGFRSFHRS